MKLFTGVKVFSATMVADRQVLGEKVTDWLAAHPTYELADVIVTQSSDSQFHCLAITVFYFDPAAWARILVPKHGVVERHGVKVTADAPAFRVEMRGGGGGGGGPKEKK